MHYLGWKRFLLAETPRGVINTIVLVKFITANGGLNSSFIENIAADVNLSNSSKMATVTMTFSALIYYITSAFVLSAVLLYPFLLCQIRGNLKEYCCHKIDKRYLNYCKLVVSFPARSYFHSSLPELVS